MKQTYEYNLNHRLLVYSEQPLNEEGKLEIGPDGEVFAYEAYVNIITQDPLNREDVWNWVQVNFGSFPKEIRTDKAPTLVELVEGVFKYIQDNYHTEVKVRGYVNDNLGEFTYIKETEKEDRILK